MQLKFPDETKADDEWAYQKLATWPNCQPHPQALERVGKLINTVKEGNVSFLPKKSECQESWHGAMVGKGNETSFKWNLIKLMKKEQKVPFSPLLHLRFAAWKIIDFPFRSVMKFCHRIASCFAQKIGVAGWKSLLLHTAQHETNKEEQKFVSTAFNYVINEKLS